nr:PREDICTED: uncharacterized protein LOC104956407 [Notothenia coriiceps]
MSVTALFRGKLWQKSQDASEKHPPPVVQPSREDDEDEDDTKSGFSRDTCRRNSRFYRSMRKKRIPSEQPDNPHLDHSPSSRAGLSPPKVLPPRKSPLLPRARRPQLSPQLHHSRTPLPSNGEASSRHALYGKDAVDKRRGVGGGRSLDISAASNSKHQGFTQDMIPYRTHDIHSGDIKQLSEKTAAACTVQEVIVKTMNSPRTSVEGADPENAKFRVPSNGEGPQTICHSLNIVKNIEHAAAPDPPVAELVLDDGVFSMAASATQLNEYDGESPSHASGPGSCTSAHDPSEEADDGSMGTVIRMALAHQQLDAQQPKTAPASVFFRHPPPLLFLPLTRHPYQRHVGGLSVLSQWSRGNCSVQLAYRCSNGLSKLVRPGNSSQLFAETCPPPVGLEAPHLPPEAAPVHRLTPMPARGLEAGGQGTEDLGPAVGYFSQQQLNYWVAQASDPWVVSTLTRGYKLQFRRRPPAFNRVKMTTISDPAKEIALNQELSVLLAKGAIEPVDQGRIFTAAMTAMAVVAPRFGRYAPQIIVRPKATMAWTGRK